MKFALLYVNEIVYNDLLWAMLNKKLDVEVIDSGISINSTAPKDAEKVTIKLKENHIDIAITMNFCPAISDACLDCNIRYISWIFDSPQQALYFEQSQNDCNYIFSFDKEQVQILNNLGCKNVYHLPLATNTLRNSKLNITESDIQKYSCDISFIGSLYEDNLYDMVYSVASDNLKKSMDTVIAENFGNWDGTNRLENVLTNSDINELVDIGDFATKIPKAMNLELFFGGRLFSRKLAFLERVSIAQMLSEYDFRLYTGSRDIPIENVNIFPKLNYSEELPKAYHLSKINLNITLHQIHSGVPLRVFDIMGVGGFMLTNFQPEITDLFAIGKELEVYRSIDELEEKALYYLTHEDARQKIALNGYKTVSENYNLERQFEKMMAFIGIKI